MLFTSTTQFVVLGLLVFIGWLFGFASHPGGKRWRQAYEEEAVGRAQDREELDHQLRHVDGRIAELEREKAELAAELEAAKASRAPTIAPAAAGVAAGAVAATEARPAYVAPPEPVPAPIVPSAPEPVAAAPQPEPILPHPHAQTPAPVAQPVAQPVAPAIEPVPVMPAPEPEPVKRGWFDWGKSDDLSRIRGIDATLERKLKDEKVVTFREIAELSDQDEIALERRLDLPAGFIQREEWRQQARLLAEGDTDTHAAHYGDRGDPVRPLPLS